VQLVTGGSDKTASFERSAFQLDALHVFSVTCRTGYTKLKMQNDYTQVSYPYAVSKVFTGTFTPM
jgi:hypothetical protein